MQTSAWISLALATLLPCSARALDSSGAPPGAGGPTTRDKPILARPDSTGPIGGMCATARGSNICRTLSDRAADHLDVRDFGAKMDGIANDSPAFSAARSLARKGQRITMPGGRINLPDSITGGPSSVVWDIQGPAFYADGTTPFTQVGNDLTRSHIDGNSEMLSRIDIAPNLAPPLRVDRQYNYTGGPADPQVVPAIQANCNLNGDGTKTAFNNYVWCNQAIMRIFDVGPGQHVAVNGTVFRDGTPPGVVDGELTSTSWAGLFLNEDNTGKYGGNQVGIEVDVVGTGLDSQKRRILIQGQISHHSPKDKPNADFSVATGVTLGTNTPKGHFGVGYEIVAPYEVAAFDASRAPAINNAPAFMMAPKQRISFDGTLKGYNRYLYWDSGLFTYQTQNGPVFQITDTGVVTAFGALKAPSLSIPDVTAPTSTNDPSGTTGEVRFAGQHMYRKTSSGWLRYSGSKF